MATIRWTLIAVLFLVWTLPATGLAEPASRNGESGGAAVVAGARTQEAAAGSRAAAPTAAETANLAERERQAQGLENFQGGSVVIYIGSGVLLVVAIILLVLLL